MQRSSLIDRRSGEDRREAHDLDYSLDGGVERRKGSERRHRYIERRSDWIKIERWYSVALRPITRTPHIQLDEKPGEGDAKTLRISRKAPKKKPLK